MPTDLRDKLREILGGLIRYPSIYMGGYWSALHKADKRRVDNTINGILALPEIAEALAGRDAVIEACARVAEAEGEKWTHSELYAETACEYAADRIRAMKAAPAPAADDYAGDVSDHDDMQRTVAIVREAYGWTITNDGRLCGLVAGDMGYASTAIVIPRDHLEAWADCNYPRAPAPAADAAAVRAAALEEVARVMDEYAATIYQHGHLYADPHKAARQGIEEAAAAMDRWLRSRGTAVGGPAQSDTTIGPKADMPDSPGEEDR